MFLPLTLTTLLLMEWCSMAVLCCASYLQTQIPTFQMYVDKFISKLDKVSSMDVVWDVHSDSTVKLARDTRATRIRTKVKATSKVPANWQGLLHVTGNLIRLVNILTTGIHLFNRPGKVLVSTVGDMVVSSSGELDLDNLAPCTH